MKAQLQVPLEARQNNQTDRCPARGESLNVHFQAAQGDRKATDRRVLSFPRTARAASVAMLLHIASGAAAA